MMSGLIDLTVPVRVYRPIIFAEFDIRRPSLLDLFNMSKLNLSNMSKEI